MKSDDEFCNQRGRCKADDENYQGNPSQNNSFRIQWLFNF